VADVNPGFEEIIWRLSGNFAADYHQGLKDFRKNTVVEYVFHFFRRAARQF
jgi:hypothetical protein